MNGKLVAIGIIVLLAITSVGNVVLMQQILSLQSGLSDLKSEVAGLKGSIVELNGSVSEVLARYDTEFLALNRSYQELLRAYEQLQASYGSLTKYFFVQGSWFDTPLSESVWWGVEAWNWNPDSVCETRDGSLHLFYNGTRADSYGNSGVFQGMHTDGRLSHELLIGASPEDAYFGDCVVFPENMSTGEFWLETKFRVNRTGFNRYPTVYDTRYARINLGFTLMCAINNDPFSSEAQTLWLDVYFAGYYLNATGVWAIPKEGHYVSYDEDIHAGYFVGEVSPESVGQWVEVRVDLGDYIGKTLDLITAVDVKAIRVYGFILFVECLGAYAETEYDYATTHV